MCQEEEKKKNKKKKKKKKRFCRWCKVNEAAGSNETCSMECYGQLHDVLDSLDRVDADRKGIQERVGGLNSDIARLQQGIGSEPAHKTQQEQLGKLQESRNKLNNQLDELEKQIQNLQNLLK